MRTRIVASLFFILTALSLMALSTDQTAPIQLVNESGAANNQVFFIAQGVDPNTHQDCFLKFDKKGVGSCIPVTLTTRPSEFSYSFAEFDAINQILHIPRIDSGRLYVSLGQKMALYTEEDTYGKIKIVSFEGFNPLHPSFYLLHDKVEFSSAPNGFFINPTAVDFFALPLQLTNEDATGSLKASGLTKNVICGKNNSCGVRDILNQFDETSSQEWQKLFVYFGQNTDLPLRVMAPGKAMYSDINGLPPFNPYYLGPGPSLNHGFYIDEVWKYYQTHTLRIDAKGINPTPGVGDEKYMFVGKVSATNPNIFVFKSPIETVNLEKPANSVPFFAGGVGTFDHENNTAKAIIVRQLTSAFTVGLLPAPDDTLLDMHYFEENKPHYYQDNAILTEQGLASGGPWYDLYAYALHSFGEPIYAFAYDDALGQDGTMHVSVHEGITTPTRITLGDMRNQDGSVAIPNPYTHKTYKKIMLDIPASITVEYQGKKLSGNAYFYENVETPLEVYINGDPTLLKIYLEYPTIAMEPYSKSAYGILVNPKDWPNPIPENEAVIKFPGAWDCPIGCTIP